LAEALPAACAVLLPVPLADVFAVDEALLLD
jgi:hypothetical protein